MRSYEFELHPNMPPALNSLGYLTIDEDPQLRCDTSVNSCLQFFLDCQISFAFVQMIHL